ncbi:MAG TPA: riboflavin biosynthesis protein RibD, partial [Devosia sp.]|nr:riboflavin biosynthesis protein RibD [Devosia sp.]
MSEPSPSDVRWLDVAARLATPALGSTGSSPTVGALVVDEDRQLLFGRAVTPTRGTAQAEVLALSEAKGLTQGRTLYLTLEPAARYTSFAPVTDTILYAGIARVVVGALDPDRKHAGQGLRAL